MSTFPPPPPPFLLTVAGDISNQISTTPPTPQHRSSSTSSTPSSIIIVIVVIASAVIVSASIYLLIRFLSRRFHRSFRTFSAADDVISSRNNNTVHIICSDNNSGPASQLLNSLPLFTFGSLTGNVAGGDCAVCLSKFEGEDRLRLLPLCCHAFHAECIDAWLASNETCPLCRSSVDPTESEIMSKIQSIPAVQSTNRIENPDRNGNSLRIEIGSISRRRGQSDSGRTSYSIGSFDYVVDEGCQISVSSTYQRGVSECTSSDKESVPEPPGENVAIDVAPGPRNWLRDYVRSLSSSFRGSGRFFSGSSRRSEVVVPVYDLEANLPGEEITEMFRWLSGV